MLGASVLDMTFNNPVVLARHLAALDFLAGAWAHVGLGSGLVRRRAA